jgi:Ca-activated chloride channel family protein
MKSENNNLEKNISRLVKLADDSNQPGKVFTESLINGAIDELSQKAGSNARDRKSTIMTAKKIFAYAAAILVVCGVLVAMMMPELSRIKHIARDTAKPAIEVQREVKSKSEPEPAKIEYTDVSKQIVEVAKPPTVTPSATQEQQSVSVNKMVAVDMARAEKLGISAENPVDNFMVTRRVAEKRFNDAATSREIGCLAPMRPACRPSMAHGGTKPPNGEDVDAMFFKNYGVNPFIDTEDDHLSTFAADVDTGSYTVVRGYLHDGHLPPKDAVRVEEFVNYFKYGYPAPQKDDFAVYSEASPWPFGTGRQNSCLLRLALKGRQISDENRKPAVLTFVIDVSGSMSREDRLGLVKKSLRLLIDRLRPEDRIGIAVYGTRGAKVMDHKGLVEKDDILAAIDSLSPSGSTNAEEGIKIGYEMAERAFKRGYINRVILCTDGVANEGRTGADDILKVIKEKADKGITLSAIGFGMGNYNDVLLERLGDKGNGHYAYVDTIAEAKRIFEENLAGTLEVIARDVKVQVDFNPDVVRSYRLIGYENRDVPDEKFRDDKYDGGEVGAGHSVTVLYELKLWPGKKGRMATTYVRYKNAENDAVTEFKISIGTGKLNRSFGSSSKQFRLAATVAEFAEILRQSYWAKGETLGPVQQKAQMLAGEFKGDADVIELVDLISKAGQLMPQLPLEPAETEQSE